MFSTFLKRKDNAYFQIGVGDGWYDLLLDMLMELDRIILRAYWYRGIEIYIDCVQLKEKFGGLRFYYDIEIKNESKRSIFFRKANSYIGLKLCRMKLYRQWWAFDGFRQTHLYQTYYEKISSIVNVASSKSFKTCEVCGEEGRSGTPKGYHWVATLCQKHYDES
jgi:hypothetical protein